MTRYKSSVYKSEIGKKHLQELYRKHLKTIKIKYREYTIDTHFGPTHIIEYGNPNGKPVLGFHGGNATNPFSLRPFVHHMNMEEIKIIVPDTIGNIGFSAEKRLSSKRNDYGKWASDIIDALNYSEIAVFGGSYGAGIALRLCAYNPEKIERLLLVVPSGIANATKLQMIKMGLPFIRYIMNPDDDKLRKAVYSFTPFEHDEFFDMTKGALLHSKFEMIMPRNTTKKELRNLKAPVYVIAEKNDILFPGEAVLKRAKSIIPNLVGTYLLELGGHGGFFKDEETHFEYYDIMSDFLLGK